MQLALSAWLFTAALVVAMVLTARALYGNTTWLTAAPAGPSVGIDTAGGQR